MKQGIFIALYFWLICLFAHADHEHVHSQVFRYGALADFFVEDRGMRMELCLPAYILEALYGFHLDHVTMEKQGVINGESNEIQNLENQVLNRLRFVSDNTPMNMKITDVRIVYFSYLCLTIEIHSLNSAISPFDFYYDTPGSYDKSDSLAVSLYEGPDKSGGAKAIAYLYGNRKKLSYREGAMETYVSKESVPFRPIPFLIILFLSLGYVFLSGVQMMKEDRRTV